MSKFTKALEKLQAEKKETVTETKEPAPKPVKKEFSYEIPAGLESTSPYWWRGIPSIRNARPEKEIVIHHHPTSHLAEQYRILRTNLKADLTKKNAKVLLISSSLQGEGKSVTTANLALSLAEIPDTKVAVIDADLRRGKLSEYFGLGKDLPGLSDYLTRGLSAKQVMVRNSQENLVIMPRGPVMKNPAEMVSSHRFRSLVAELRAHFDYILIDSPPIMSVTDASIIGRETDGLLMVIRSRKTPKSVIAHANHLFKQGGVPMLGYILTAVEYQSNDYRYYHNYYETSNEQEQGVKARIGLFFKKLSFLADRRENQFHYWWERKMGRKRKIRRTKTEEEAKVNG